MPETASHPLRLDRSRYHSSEHGDFDGPARFWQDGLPFDPLGHLCTELCNAEQLAEADRRAPRRPTPDADMPDQFGHPTPDEFADGVRVRDRVNEVNLELWAKGEARYVPAKVFAAIRERYNKSVSTFADAIEFLVSDAKLIPLGQASKKLLTMGGGAPVKEEA